MMGAALIVPAALAWCHA